MPDLWGIDDENEALRIRTKAVSKARHQTTAIQWTVALAIIAITILWVEVFNFPAGWPRITLLIMGLSLASIWQNRRIAARLPETLAREGRCTKCGYDLTNNAGGPCPECGETIRVVENADGNRSKDNP